jgi:hypothetical protein
MHIENAEEFATSLRQAVDRNCAESVQIIFIDDVDEWCVARNGQCAGNPPAMAIRYSPSNEAAILIRRGIDAVTVRGIKDRMFVCGLELLSARLDEPEAFLTHLALHELAHLVNGWGQAQECDCDEWAFRAMGLNED